MIPGRPRAHRPRRFRPGLERLGPRELLAGAIPAGSAPTEAAQYMLELINRARADPPAEGRRLLTLAQSDPTLRQATANWDLNRFTQVISSYPPSPPLAFNPRLIDAARAENAAMLATNSQRHSPAGFLNDPSVATDTDGRAYYPAGNGWWSTGENIFAFSANVAGTSPTRYADYFEAGFLLDWGNPDFGHLRNILAPGPSQGLPANPSATAYPIAEVGIDLMTDAHPTVPPGVDPLNPGNSYLSVGPALVTQEFGWRTGDAFLTGTFYIDYAGSRLYAPGEGLGGVTVTAVGTAGQGTFRAQTWATGGYSLPLPPGTYRVSATGPLFGGPRSTTVTIGVDNVGWGAGVPWSPADLPVPADYDGIGRAEFATYQPSTGRWSIDSPTTGPRVQYLGQPGDVPVPGHYDGGKSEVAVFRPSDGTWSILGPNGLRVVPFGQRGDVPVPGDYDGDGKTDLAVFRPSNAVWYIWNSRSRGFTIQQWGVPNLDQPVPAAYDGGGVTEIAVLRPTTFEWFIFSPLGIRSVRFGCPGSIPVPAPYDGGGKAEVAVYLPRDSGFYVLNTAPYGTTTFFGSPGIDQPVPADYDGDGKVDLAVFRPFTAEWFARGSRGAPIQDQFGLGGTARTFKAVASAVVPVPAAWVPWVGSPGAESAAGLGPSPTLRPPSPRRPIVVPTRQAGVSGRL